jgi:predicted secreted protein
MPAQSAHGSTLFFDSIYVSGLTSISLPDQSKDPIEVTSHDSAGWRERVAGLRDGGTITLGARLVPEDAGQQALDDNFNSDVDVDIVITAPPDSNSNQVSWTFQGNVSATGGELPFDDAAEVSYTIQIKREVTRATTASPLT